MSIIIKEKILRGVAKYNSFLVRSGLNPGISTIIVLALAVLFFKVKDSYL